MDNPGTLNPRKDNAVRESDVKEKAEEIKEQVASRAEHLKERSGQFADRIATQAKQATSRLGETIEHASESVRERGHGDGRVAGATRAVADTMQRAGSYLQNTGFRSITHDIADAIQRHPVRAVFIGAGIGYLFGRMTRR